MKKLMVVVGLFIILSLSLVYADSIDNIINQAIANPAPVSPQQDLEQEQLLQSLTQQQNLLSQNLTQQQLNETQAGVVVETAVTGKVKSVETADAETIAKNKAIEKKGLKKYFAEREKFNKANEKVKAAKIKAKAEEAAKIAKASKTSTTKTSTRIKTVVRVTGKVIVDIFDSVSSRFSGITGNIAKNYEYNNLELPEVPKSPGAVEEVMKPKFSFAKLFRFLTGYAIIGVPDWSYDGSLPGNYIWKVDYTTQAGNLQHFELKLDVNMADKVNGIVYSKGYYLDEKKAKWEEFEFSGTKIGSTGWIRENAIASMTPNNFTNNDYAIFLAYSCSKKMQQDWDCNGGKWVIFVVETGNVSYHQDIGEIPEMQYTEIKDLNITDIPSVLKQLGLSALDFQPVMHDALLISPKTDFVTSVNQVEKFEFYVKNGGNRVLTNLTFELDIGEQVLAEVVDAEIPDKLEINETVKGSVSLLFKESGNWKFPLFLKPKQEEVDTSDNIIRFSINVSGEIKPNMPQDSLTDAWNRKINYTVKEEFQQVLYARNSSLVIISGTNKMRAVFGGYYKGRSINPTMKVYLKPLVTEEALFSTPYVASIFIGGEMMTGDRENVNYYVVLKNEKTGKTYTTPKMESMYKYYYNPRELIPDFEFCTDYSAKVILVGRTSETIDIIQPQGFNLCDFGKNIGQLVRTKRLLKLDGDYVAVSFNLNEKYFEPGQIISYKIEFTDKYNQKYTTRIINSSEGLVLLKLSDVIPRSINFQQGETFVGRVILLNSIVTRQGSIKLGKLDGKIHFVWNNWSIVASLQTGLILKDEKIILKGVASTYATSSLAASSDYNPLWSTRLNFNVQSRFPGYFDSSVKQKIQSETEYVFSIKDLTDNRNVYELGLDCSNVLPGSPSGGSSTTFYKDHGRWLFCYVDGGIGLDIINLIQALPEFISGHYYEFSLKVVSENADLYAPIRPIKILYIDGYQFVANTPLLRTRFLYLENHPKFVSLPGSPSDEGKYTPAVSVRYSPRNLFFNETSNRIDFTDSSQREIKLSELLSVSDFWNSDRRYDYQQIQGSAKPLFDKLEIVITPLMDLLQIKRAQFNCKLGKYDLVCNRDSSRYSIVYIDELNNFVYTIYLTDDSGRFLKKYRDNPQAYDAVIYDILSEIDRNPITSLIPTQTIEKKFPDVRLITSGNQLRFMVLRHSGQYSGSNITLKDGNCFYNQTSADTYGDYIFSEGFYGVNSGLNTSQIGYVSPCLEDYILKVFSANSLIFSGNIGEKYCSSVVTFQKALSKLVTSLNLTNNEVYGFELVPVNKTKGIYSFAYPFKYKRDYEKEVVEDNANYMRKIPEINSTLMGPYDFVFDYNYPCAQKDYSNASISQLKNGFFWSSNVNLYMRLSPFLDSLENNYQYLFALFSVNPPAVKNFYSGEETTLEEFRNNTRGERRLILDSNRFYAFSVFKFDDVYKYYGYAPVQSTSYDTNLTGLSCSSNKRGLTSPEVPASSLTLSCRFANINDLKVYQLEISQIFPGKTAADLSNLPVSTLQDFKDNYAEVVLRKYLEWYPPTPILNSTFFSF